VDRADHGTELVALLRPTQRRRVARVEIWASPIVSGAKPIAARAARMRASAAYIEPRHAQRIVEAAVERVSPYRVKHRPRVDQRGRCTARCRARSCLRTTRP
jgi:hypothetical protein